MDSIKNTLDIITQIDEYLNSNEKDFNNLALNGLNERELAFAKGHINGEDIEYRNIKSKLESKAEIASIINYIDEKASARRNFSKKTKKGEYRIELEELDKINPSLQDTKFDYNRGILIGKIDALTILRGIIDQYNHSKSIEDTNAKSIEIVEVSEDDV